ncbi:hypothetical protein G7K_5095-t2 [Saitoella complicata NRRL Y-17804]|uniref:Uncharacterized protein n=1 Tax=Saitoella complicata (strain BCRC 22490 / CBS 7301 / JCM 7358 / NBRC 10748 / NRRL Y-17804) TaxID=698492 RepID=A0A0E9NMS8_SAICN|nr:hypothetical protein G7K_5095-t2 [Saitoella complicata NRRL Y-17804]
MPLNSLVGQHPPARYLILRCSTPHKPSSTRNSQTCLPSPVALSPPVPSCPQRSPLLRFVITDPLPLAPSRRFSAFGKVFCGQRNLLTSEQAIGAPKDALRMSRIVDFYSKLPAGPAPKQQVPNNVFAAYKHKYFDGDNASGVPLLHLIGFVMAVSYTFCTRRLGSLVRSNFGIEGLNKRDNTARSITDHEFTVRIHLRLLLALAVPQVWCPRLSDEHWIGCVNRSMDYEGLWSKGRHLAFEYNTKDLIPSTTLSFGIRHSWEPWNSSAQRLRPRAHRRPIPGKPTQEVSFDPLEAFYSSQSHQEGRLDPEEGCQDRGTKGHSQQIIMADVASTASIDPVQGLQPVSTVGNGGDGLADGAVTMAPNAGTVGDQSESRPTSSSGADGQYHESHSSAPTSVLANEPLASEVAKASTAMSQPTDTPDRSQGSSPVSAASSSQASGTVSEATTAKAESAGTTTAKPALVFKKPAKFTSSSINKAFLEKASGGVSTGERSAVKPLSHHLAEKQRPNISYNPINPHLHAIPAKPRLSTKISAPAPYNLPSMRREASSSPKPLGQQAQTSTTSAPSGITQPVKKVPEAIPVWNKNQPQPVKEVTDEDLKGKGIHLAMAPSAKEGQWDEDDDELDWGDTIEFGDGTKVVLKDEESAPAPAPVEPEPEKKVEQKSAKSAASPANPWAPIPKPTPAPVIPGARGDGRREDRFGGDDYDRSWRAPMDHPHARREIFNDRTGQFDRVDDMHPPRRGRAEYIPHAPRPDFGRRPPEVLQRPGHGPVFTDGEPGYTGGDARRRPSAANERMPSFRRMSDDRWGGGMPLPSHLPVRRESLKADEALSAPEPPKVTSPPAPAPGPVETEESISKRQLEAMKEAKERAIRRRQEEEAERQAQAERARKKAAELALAKEREEAEKKAKEEEARRVKEEEQRKIKEQADCKAKEEAEKKAAEAQKKREAEQKAREDAESKAKPSAKSDPVLPPNTRHKSDGEFNGAGWQAPRRAAAQNTWGAIGSRATKNGAPPVRRSSADAGAGGGQNFNPWADQQRSRLPNILPNLAQAAPDYSYQEHQGPPVRASRFDVPNQAVESAQQPSFTGVSSWNAAFPSSRPAPPTVSENSMDTWGRTKMDEENALPDFLAEKLVADVVGGFGESEDRFGRADLAPPVSVGMPEETDPNSSPKRKESRFFPAYLQDYIPPNVNFVSSVPVSKNLDQRSLEEQWNLAAMAENPQTTSPPQLPSPPQINLTPAAKAFVPVKKAESDEEVKVVLPPCGPASRPDSSTLLEGATMAVVRLPVIPVRKPQNARGRGQNQFDDVISRIRGAMRIPATPAAKARMNGYRDWAGQNFATTKIPFEHEKPAAWTPKARLALPAAETLTSQTLPNALDGLFPATFAIVSLPIGYRSRTRYPPRKIAQEPAYHTKRHRTFATTRPTLSTFEGPLAAYKILIPGKQDEAITVENPKAPAGRRSAIKDINLLTPERAVRPSTPRTNSQKDLADMITRTPRGPSRGGFAARGRGRGGFGAPLTRESVVTAEVKLGDGSGNGNADNIRVEDMLPAGEGKD